MSNLWLWWVDLPIKAYDEQLVEEKKSKRQGPSWGLQSKDVWYGWLTLYKQTTHWSPERGKNGGEIHHILRKPSFTKGQQAFRQSMFEEENEMASALLVSKYMLSFEGFKIFLANRNWGLLSFSFMFLKSKKIIWEKKRKSSKIKDLALSFLHVSDESFGCTRHTIFYLGYP